ncbi:thiosulfate sulfurtransferase [Peniophora sp. CONT]|nr:thiosulfate sulfurtransferase [Peniophora sp. CONT]
MVLTSLTVGLRATRPRVLVRAMSIARTPLVLSPNEVSQLAQSSKVAFLDASWHMPNSPRNAAKEFTEKHITGARFFDLDAVASSHELGLKHMMPSGQVFASALQSLGITPDTHVVLYDTVGVFSSPRALFTFRSLGHTKSSILNGGLIRWEEEGLEVDGGEPAEITATSEYPAPTLQENSIQSYEQIVENSKADPAQDADASLVLDARPRGRFLGTDPEPRPGISSGHMPHALSLPFNAFVKANTIFGSDKSYTTLLSPEEIRGVLEKTFGQSGAQEIMEGKRKITTTCGSGMTAAVLWLGLKTVNEGIPISLYDESWTGYAMREKSKIIKEES